MKGEEEGTVKIRTPPDREALLMGSPEKVKKSAREGGKGQPKRKGKEGDVVSWDRTTNNLSRFRPRLVLKLGVVMNPGKGRGGWSRWPERGPGEEGGVRGGKKRCRP